MVLTSLKFVGTGVAVVGLVVLAWGLPQSQLGLVGESPRSFMLNDGRFALECTRSSASVRVADIDDDLSEVVAKLQPTIDSSLSEWLHAVHLFGPEAVVGVTGKKILPMITDSRLGQFDLKGRILTRTRYGLRFPLVTKWMLSHPQAHAESHPGQGLATLAGAGVPLNSPVYIGDDDRCFVRDILNDVVANFVLEGETYWDVVALAIYLAPAKHWENKFGVVFSFDEVVEDLMQRSPNESSCAGTHGLIALTTILRVDEKAEFLSPGVRDSLRRHLGQAVTQLEANQIFDGGWSFQWSDDDFDPLATSPGADEVILATGHHLEWLLLLPAELAPDNETFQIAARNLKRLLKIQVKDEGWVTERYCPAVHAARSLSLISTKSVKRGD